MSDGFYAWELTGGRLVMESNGLWARFCSIAAAHALKLAGLARSVLDEVWSLLEQHFWPSQGAYLDELSWPERVPDSYRGRMPICTCVKLV